VFETTGGGKKLIDSDLAQAKLRRAVLSGVVGADFTGPILE